MNNQTCPVSGNPVNKNSTYVHKGKEYNLCSEECKQPLSENPEKYLPEEE
ncbi:MAG: YHS domain-containing protein [Chlamydiae bacterium]|nr:YHS domain-containing protein [Chlamydiota bacterium]